jgi:hypothetical protein
MEETKKKISEIFDVFLMEARQIWPTSQFSILALKSMILNELERVNVNPKKPDGNQIQDIDKD